MKHTIICSSFGFEQSISGSVAGNLFGAVVCMKKLRKYVHLPPTRKIKKLIFTVYDRRGPNRIHIKKYCTVLKSWNPIYVEGGSREVFLFPQASEALNKYFPDHEDLFVLVEYE